MTKKEKQIYITVIVVLVVVALVWLLRAKPSDQTQTQSDLEQQSSTQQDNNNTGLKMPDATNTWTGTLKMSDNSKKGNLMLVTSDHTIYLKTSRNFSALIGKEVVVTYSGTTNSFVLGNITAK
ncbi:MAG TPA: hypothetical protein VE973_01700 [Candidatus Limnocylindria bacterium]|nr:hypothetical protein [Candidatus Limnocylindria bacterium]